MDFGYSEKTQHWLERLSRFMDEHIYPNDALYEEQLHSGGPEAWVVPAILPILQKKARQAGLWTLHMQDPDHGAGLSNLEYAPLAEMLGRVHWASEVFNCSAPDSGNMDVLSLYGSPEQKKKWLEPLLNAEIRSSFVMTEPAVASSDATNIETSIVRDGDEYVINGHKWWITNAYHPNTKIYIVMGKTDPTAERHLQQTQILVEPDTPGITLVRSLNVFGYRDEPKGHAEVLFENVRVPAANVLLGEGRGFEIAQGRLGPGRIHHCMRLVGVAEVTLEKMCKRLVSRSPFGKPLSDQSIWQHRVAEIRTDIEMCRMMVYKAAWMMDTVGVKAARSEIAQIKVAVTCKVQKIIDIAIQAHGAAGVSDDFGLGFAYARARVMRLGDGPDEVHNRTIARLELNKYRPARKITK